MNFDGMDEMYERNIAQPWTPVHFCRIAHFLLILIFSTCCAHAKLKVLSFPPIYASTYTPNVHSTIYTCIVCRLIHKWVKSRSIFVIWNTTNELSLYSFPCGTMGEWKILSLYAYVRFQAVHMWTMDHIDWIISNNSVRCDRDTAHCKTVKWWPFECRFRLNLSTTS